MKNYLMLLSLLWMLPLKAQQTQPTTIITQKQQSEPDAPTVLSGEAEKFLRNLENAIQQTANKSLSRAQRILLAKSFSKQFADKAVIQVMNGSQIISLAPMAYFTRLIDLDYDQVEIKFEVEKSDPFQKTEDSWWHKKYTLKQTFKGTRKDKKDKKAKAVTADYTIKTFDLFFLYTASTRTWTKKYGHILALYSEKVPLNGQ